MCSELASIRQLVGKLARFSAGAPVLPSLFSLCVAVKHAVLPANHVWYSRERCLSS